MPLPTPASTIILTSTPMPTITPTVIPTPTLIPTINGLDIVNNVQSFYNNAFYLLMAVFVVISLVAGFLIPHWVQQRQKRIFDSHIKELENKFNIKSIQLQNDFNNSLQNLQEEMYKTAATLWTTSGHLFKSPQLAFDAYTRSLSFIVKYKTPIDLTTHVELILRTIEELPEDHRLGAIIYLTTILKDKPEYLQIITEYKKYKLNPYKEET
jgi:hypothetical protein